MAFDYQRQRLLYAYLPEKRSPFRSTGCSGPIPLVGTTFLGIIFDRSISFVTHLKYVKKKGLKALNILKVIDNTEWGADRKVMLRFYRYLMRSKLEYGCIVHGRDRKSYWQIGLLDPVHNQCLRPCLVPFSEGRAPVSGPCGTRYPGLMTSF